MNTCSLKVLDRTLSFLLADAEPAAGEIPAEWIQIFNEYQSLANRHMQITNYALFKFLHKKTAGFSDDDKKRLIQYLYDNV